MAAYVIAEIMITNMEMYGEFVDRVTPTVEGHGGKFVARGGTVDVILGDWAPKRIALVEFGSVAQARAWLNSPEYNALNEMREASSNISMVVVEGL